METNNVFYKIKEKGIKHILMYTIPWKVNNSLNKVISFLGYKLYINTPLKDVIIIESHNDFDSNGGAFYDYLIDNGFNKKYKIVWFLRNDYSGSLPENVEGYRYNAPSLKRVYYHCVAKYIVCGHWIIPKLRDGQISIYTTHGGFGLKNTKGKINIPTSISYVLSPSDELMKNMADQFSMEFPSKRLIALGYPCQDILYANTPGDLHKITNNHYNKVILWMPTFRSTNDRHDSVNDFPLGIPLVKSNKEFTELNEWLSARNSLLIIKIHPMQDLLKIKVKSMSNIIILNGKDVKKIGVDNYRLMKDTDALISDYSSSAYDYLHLNKPIAYTLDDINSYALGLSVDNPEDYMAGHIIYNLSDLMDFLNDVINEEDPYDKKRELLVKKIWKYQDGNSSQRLADFLGLKK